MGELAPNSNELPNSGPLHRSPRWQNAHETTGNFVWGKTGMKTTATFLFISHYLQTRPKLSNIDFAYCL